METITAENHEEKLGILNAMIDDNPVAGTPEADELEALASAIATYEETAFPIEQPSFQAMEDFRKEQNATPATHILFYYDLGLGKSKEMTGNGAALREWARMQVGFGNIRGNWDVDKL